MNDGSRRNIIPAQGGLINELSLRMKLISRLMADGRVSLLLKAIPIASLVYFISPVDLVPGMTLPIVGALDDAAILWLGAYFFVEMCPTEVVKEHLKRLVSNNAAVDEAARQQSEEEVIDVEATDVTADDKK